MEHEARYRLLARQIETMPDFPFEQELTYDQHAWLAKSYALIEDAGDLADIVAFKVAQDQLRSFSHDGAVRRIAGLLHRTLAVTEMELPHHAQGAFISTGGELDALAALAKPLKSAKNDVLFIDPYLDDVVVTDFCALVEAGVSLRLLTDPAGMKGSLEPAVRRFAGQRGGNNPIEVRTTEERALHDRLIVIDRSEVWILTQSFKDIAKRSPASLSRAEPEAGELKLRFYEGMWAAAAAI